MWEKLGVVALLFTITFGFISPGWFVVGCLALLLIYVADDTQRRRQ